MVRYSSMGRSRGFTLIEILLVIVILIIVIFIIILAINPTRQLNDVRVRELESGQQQLEYAINQYYVSNQSWPVVLSSDLQAIGTTANNCADDYVYWDDSSGVSEVACIDLDAILTPDFLTNIPIATNINSSLQTGYAVTLENNRPKVYVSQDALDAVGGSTPKFSATTNQPPTASSVFITGTFQENQTLSASYTYSDPDGDPELNSTISWYQADDVLGTDEVLLVSGTGNTFGLNNSHSNKFIKIQVEPHAQTGSSPGSSINSPWQGPVVSVPYAAVGGLTVIKATSELPLPGQGAYSGKTWQLTTGSDGANQYYKALPNTGQNTLDNLLGPRFDYDINFTEVGTYRVFVRMNGPGGTNDSVHVSYDSNPLTYGRFGMTRGGWGWVSSVSGRPGPDEVEFNVATPGVRTVSVWMREDGTEYDCLVLKHTVLQGTSNPTGNVCPAETGK